MSRSGGVGQRGCDCLGIGSRVEYQLTSLERTLLAPIDAVGAWAFEHGDELMITQEADCTATIQSSSK